jgi:hypothetical protein
MAWWVRRGDSRSHARLSLQALGTPDLFRELSIEHHPLVEIGLAKLGV